MKKRLLSLLMAAFMVTSLAACGSTGSTSAAGSAASAEGSAASAEGSAATTSTTTSATGEAFKIGGTGPLTGGAAIYGNAAKNGAQIAVDEINAMGGIQFELRYEDDIHDPEKAINAYNTLKDWGMQLSVGSVTSKPCEATSAETYADRIFALTPSASSVAVLEGKDNQFQICFIDPNQGAASAQYIFDKKLGTKVAVIWKNDDVYSKGIYETFMQKAKELGLKVVSDTTFADGNDTDFSVQLTDAQNNGADLIFLPMYYQPASLILAQANTMDYTPKYFGVDGMDGILTMEGFDPSLAEGLMLLTPFSATVPETKSFVDAYVAANGVQPNQFAADAYDGVYIVKEALEKAGCTADMSSADICEALVAQMTQISYSGLTGKDMTWNAEGQVSKAPTAYVIKDGEYVLPEA